MGWMLRWFIKRQAPNPKIPSLKHEIASCAFDIAGTESKLPSLKLDVVSRAFDIASAEC